jgi:hypothetical protein
MKKCNYCKKNKEDKKFRPNKKTCIECSAYKARKNKEWRERNPALIHTCRKEWYRNNPDYYHEYNGSVPMNYQHFEKRFDIRMKEKMFREAKILARRKNITLNELIRIATAGYITANKYLEKN